MRVGRKAIIADPHFHDITYRPGTQIGSAVRSLADTCESTRVFNESYHALTALLDDIVRRGISIVVIDGDLTDDGKASSMSAATDLLRRYAAQHGLRFFAAFGNHDVYAIHGRHQSKRFLDPSGVKAPAACVLDYCPLTQRLQSSAFWRARDRDNPVRCFPAAPPRPSSVSLPFQRNRKTHRGRPWTSIEW